MKKSALILMILTLAAVTTFTASCFKKKGGEGKKVDQVFTFCNASEPETLDPHLMTGNVEGNIAHAIFEGLVSLDHETLKPIPGVAEKWEVSPDGLTWTFHLRKNAKWSNGDPITADDFVYSVRRLLAPTTAGEYVYMAYHIKNAKAYRDPKAYNLKPIKDTAKIGVKALDAHTLQFELENPVAYFLDIIAFRTLFPVHKATLEKFKEKWTRPENIVTNGPFILKEWLPRDKIILVKNPKYWDAKVVKLEKIIVLATEDENTMFNLYESNRTEWVYHVALPQIPVLRKQGRKDFHLTPYLSTYYYLINTTRKPFNDPRVRKALDMSIDKEKLCKYVTQAGEKPADSFVPRGMPGYTPPKGLPFDVAAARKLLAEAGFPDGKGFPKAVILFNTSDNHKKIAEVIQSDWKKNLNIDIQLENKEWKVYLKDRQTLDYDIGRAGWTGDYVDPNTFLDMFVTGGGNNHTGWGMKRYDDLIAKAAATLDPVERKRIFVEAENILINDEMPIIPLYYYVNKNLLKPWVKNFYFNIIDYHNYKYVYIAPH